MKLKLHFTMKLKLNESKDEFCLMSADAGANFKAVIKDVSIFVRKVKLNNSVSLAHARAIENATAKYPLRHVLTKMLSITIGKCMSFVQDHRSHIFRSTF